MEIKKFITKKDIKIGMKFLTGGKHKRLCTVIDIFKKYNSKNELIKTSYLEQHEFCGQILTSEVCCVTIQKGNYDYLKTLKN